MFGKVLIATLILLLTNHSTVLIALLRLSVSVVSVIFEVFDSSFPFNRYVNFILAKLIFIMWLMWTF